MINAFRQIRLTNTLLTVTGLGAALQVGAETVVYQSQTGVFYPASNPSGFIGSAQTGNFANTVALAATGASLQLQVNALNVWTGKQQNFSNQMIPTGQDSYFVPFPVNFSSAPRIVTSVEVAGNVLYQTAIQNRTVSGFTAIFSDIIAESGVYLHTIASIN